MPSRGIAISAYSAPFSKGAKIYGANIQSGVVTSAHIADGTVVAAEVADGAITSAKLGAGAVTSAKVANNGIVKAKIRSAVITGTITSSGITYAKAHGLGAIPNVVIVSVRDTLAKISAGTNVGESSASARTSTNIYLVGRPHGAKYTAYCIV